MNSSLLGWGFHLPSRVVTNFDLEKMADTTNEWIVQRSGIEERRYAAETETPSDLARAAAERALAMAGASADEIDMIVYATLSPEYFFPGGGVLLQEKLGLPPRAALDVRNQCAGFLYGLEVADALIKSGKRKKVLLVGAEIHSRFLDYSQSGRHVAVLFGDGAGAFLLGDSDAPGGVIDTILYSEGKHARELMIECPGSAQVPAFSREMLDDGRIYPHMNGKFVFKHAVTRMTEVTREILARNSLAVADINLFIYHQANLRINQAVAQDLGIPPERVFNNIQKVGNTSAASIPIAFSQAADAGRVRRGDLALVASFGSGFTWGAAIIRV